jgi:hypothetical protein
MPLWEDRRAAVERDAWRPAPVGWHRPPFRTEEMCP